ncbi:MAG: nucleotide exchange factor GrpE [Verrucomicrobia bacterium 21-51-4]|nr:MAG: nucleotide exchange factor GrpE [Verrucomicrobia bacterium 21-51-4]HQU08846.1 nucleotide exchange factor GrpE [Opitutales bacterium]
MTQGDERTHPAQDDRPVNFETQSQDLDGQNAPDALRTELETVRGDLAKQQELMVRTLADLDNVRRRAVRDREQIQKTATERLMVDLIPVIDVMRLGLEAALKDPHAQNIVDGFKMAVDQLERSLAAHGLECMDPTGAKFDPNLHECIAHVPTTDQEDGTVLQVARCGYRLGEKLLRPAAVVVASSGKEGEQ